MHLQLFRLDGLSEGWPEDLHEQKVSVSGNVVSKKLDDGATEAVFLSPAYHKDVENPDAYLKKD